MAVCVSGGAVWQVMGMKEDPPPQVVTVGAQVHQAANAHRRRTGKIKEYLESWRSLCKENPIGACQLLRRNLSLIVSYMNDARAICEAAGFDLETGAIRSTMTSPNIENADVAQVFASDPAFASLNAIRMYGIVLKVLEKCMSVLTDVVPCTDLDRIEHCGAALIEATLSEPYLMDLLGIQELTHENHRRYTGAAAISLSGVLAKRIRVNQDEPKNRRIVDALTQDLNPGERLVQTLERLLPAAVFEAAREKQPTDLRSLRTVVQNIIEHGAATVSVKSSLTEEMERIPEPEEFSARDEAKRDVEEEHWKGIVAELRSCASLSKMQDRVLTMWLIRMTEEQTARKLGPTFTAAQVQAYRQEIRKKFLAAAGIAA